MTYPVRSAFSRLVSVPTVSPIHHLPSGERHDDDLPHYTDLLQALTARLRSSVRAGAADASAESAFRLQQVVLDCASDLDLLHRALRAESARQQQLHKDVVQAIAGLGEPLPQPRATAREKPWWGKRPSAFYKIFS